MAGKRCIIPVLPAVLRKAGAALIILAAAAALLLWPRGANLPDSGKAGREAPQGLNDYQVTLRLNPEENTLAVSETIRFRNDTGDPLDSLMLRTWLNAFKTEDTSPAALEELYDACYPDGFSSGGITIYDVILRLRQRG